MTSLFLDPILDDDHWRARLFAGDIVAFSPRASSLALADLARKMLEEAFAPHDPREVHRHRTPEEVAAILGVYKPRFIHHPECKRLIAALMAELGVDTQQLYFDVPRLRSAYPSDFLSSGIAYAFHPHRDTWYSAPACQLNWWIPVYPLVPENAMNFYPRYFSEAVRNNSEIYNYYEWNARSRAVAVQHVRSDTRQQPKPQQELDPLTMRYLPPPGGVILFSAAQLHETVPNSTDHARYSLDFRTVHLDDLVGQRGAPNLDSRCTGTTLRDYVRASDGQRLPEEVVRLYDDETAAPDKLLLFGDRLLQGDDGQAAGA